MKNKIIQTFIKILFLSVLFSFKGIDNILPIGGELPKGDVKMLSVNGNMVSMRDVKKPNGLLVIFSCNTCPFVIRNQQRTQIVCTYAQQNNIGVILINSNEGQREDEDSFKEMQVYAREQGYQWNYVVDKNNEIADGFGATRTPECFLFDKALKLSYHGAIDDNPGDDKNVKRHYLNEAINELLSGKDISIKESRSVGCGIKRKG